MNSTQFFQQVSQIKRMERGKLTIMSQGPEGPHYKLQAWEKGKNVSRHVARDQANAVQDALEGYHKFQDLTQQYAQAVIDQTRVELSAQSKKRSTTFAGDPPGPGPGNPRSDGPLSGCPTYRGGRGPTGDSRPHGRIQDGQ